MRFSMSKTKLAIIGIGHLGSRHLKVCAELKSKVEIVGICDVKKDRTIKLAEHYKVPYFKDHTQLLDQVDAVDICVPTKYHFAVARDFIKKGIHTFVEKPITTTLAQANKLVDLSHQHNVKLQVGHVEHFNSAFQAIKRLAKNPLFIECHRLNRFPNRSLDIGVVEDLMIHDIDIVLGLVKSEIKDIQAVGVKVITPLSDIANARITFSNGCTCNLTSSRISDDVMRKIRIFLKNTYISLDYVTQEAFVYKKNRRMITKHALPIQKEEPLKEELESFIDCVQNNKRPLVSGEEGREALRVALAIKRRIWQNPQNK